MATTLDVSVEIPPLPEGWSGTPDELFEFFKENAVFTIDGDIPVGQVGGADPTEDVGVLYQPDAVSLFLNGKYRPITDVPIGSLLAWAGSGAVAPTNYLFCGGQSISRTDYAELFIIIGTTYGTPISDSTFKLPDMRGRIPVGAGEGQDVRTGDYALNPGGIIGRITEIVVGAYSGFEFFRTKPKPPGYPSSAGKITAQSTVLTTTYTDTANPRVGMNYIIRYR